MLASLTNIFRIGDLRRKILFTLLMLVVFRIGSFVPVPNVNVELFQQNTSHLLGLLNTLEAHCRTTRFLPWEFFRTLRLRSSCS